ncbi:MAG TPA: hypothetical protein PL076_06060 [Bacillota bacterium]|jgi:hypothetical protein|nr:hypothetical protein [Bacillota bacterium]HQI15348.1 hypothetical protein [Bacillota bacterium]HQJ36410.1 hypothetical protein [Bacillota bacterium]HRS20749.1 hypothetical protein [Clostridia bacterium]HRU42511.1 hypothetical protein [Candidatus Diapherotrites archaeon]
MKGRKKAALLAGLMLMAVMLCAFEINVDNKDKVAIFNDIEIPAGVTVNGDVVALFGDVAVNGDLTGNAVTIFGDMSVSGTIDGDVVAVFGEVSVKDGGIINGDAVGILGGVDKSPTGVIRGEIADINAPFNVKKHDGWIPRVSYVDMIGLVAIYAFSCLAILIAPGRVRLMSEESRSRPGRRFAIGFVIMMLFIPSSIILSILLAITLIGIIFIPFIFIAFILVIFIGMVAVEVAIGHRLTGQSEGNNALFINLMVGVLLVYVLKIIPVLGWLAYFALVAYAVGVAFDTRLGAPTAGKQVPNV